MTTKYFLGVALLVFALGAGLKSSALADTTTQILQIAHVIHEASLGVGNVLQDCPKKATRQACRQCCSDTLDDKIYERCIRRCNMTYDDVIPTETDGSGG